jgi:hypothetical protein
MKRLMGAINLRTGLSNDLEWWFSAGPNLNVLDSKGASGKLHHIGTEEQ